MTWPTIFANLAAGNQPLSLFDTMFTQVAQMVAIPCTPSGINSITLSPIGSAPTLPNYQNFSSFRFVAGSTTTGAVSAQFQALANLPVYLSDGLTQASATSIATGQEYVLVFAQFLNGGAGGFFLEAASVVSGGVFAPNIQVFTSGTAATYTTPTAGAKLPLYLRVRMVGGGGGGGAGATNNGSNGGDTSFAGWTAIHGIGGPAGNSPAVNGALGGSGGVNGTGTQITRMAGAPGAGGYFNTVSGSYSGGGGGNSVFGGGGLGNASTSVGGNAAANSGSGGGGASTGATQGAGGGGAGEFVEFIITSPAASYVYTVGASGAGGAAGTNAGGNGGAGRIEVIAYWQ